MPHSDPDRSPTHWPDNGAEVPLQAVSRLIYASLANVNGPVLDEMRRIRDRAVFNNQPAGLRVALLHMSGWFVEWIEGTAPGIRALLDRVARDRRHQGLRVVHQSVGRPRLFRPWIGALVQGDEGPSAFARRLFALEADLQHAQESEPASVWLRLCAPPAPDMPVPAGLFPRAMLISAHGTQAFDVLTALASRFRRPLVRRRFAGAADEVRDVESDYLDLAASGQAGWRLIAQARKGLAMGVAHAFLPDHAAVVVIVGEHPERNRLVIERVLLACRQVHHAPVIIGLGTAGNVTPELQELVERQGLPWLPAISPESQPGPLDLWSALEPVLLRLG